MTFWFIFQLFLEVSVLSSVTSPDFRTLLIESLSVTIRGGEKGLDFSKDAVKWSMLEFSERRDTRLWN